MVSSQYRIIALQKEVGRSITATATPAPAQLLIIVNFKNMSVYFYLDSFRVVYYLKHLFALNQTCRKRTYKDIKFKC